MNTGLRLSMKACTASLVIGGFLGSGSCARPRDPGRWRNRTSALRPDCPSCSASQCVGPSAMRFGERKGFLLQLVVRHDAVDEADRLAPRGIDPLVGEHQFARARRADEARQQPGDAVVAGQRDVADSRWKEMPIARRCGCRRPSPAQGRRRPRGRAAPRWSACGPRPARRSAGAAVPADRRPCSSSDISSRFLSRWAPMPLTLPPAQNALPAPVMRMRADLRILAAGLDHGAQRRREIVGHRSCGHPAGSA